MQNSDKTELRIPESDNTIKSLAEEWINKNFKFSNTKQPMVI